MRASGPNRLYSIALWVDRYVGSALCAGLLGVKKLMRGERPPLAAEDVRKVLLLKMWGMGSIVLATPLLEAIRQRYPGARVDFLTLTENRAILDRIPGIDDVVLVDLRRGVAGFLLDTLRSIRAIRREGYDLLLDLEFFTRFSSIFSFLAKPRRSHGFSAKGKWRGKLHDVEVPFNAYNHVALNFLDLLRGQTPPPSRTKTYPAPDRKALLSAWFPLTPAALLSSRSAPTTTVSPDTATEWPNKSPAPVLDALR